MTTRIRRSSASRVSGFALIVGASLALRVAVAAARAAEDGQWTMPAKDYASTRYSGLAQINAGNATRLRPVWTFSTGVLAGHEGQPLVVNDTMYVVTPWPNVLYAFDLTKEGYPLRWKYRPDVSPNAIGISCCDVDQPRRVLRRRQDRLQPARRSHRRGGCGERARSVEDADRDLAEGETTPMAPFVAKDRVIVGASGGEFGIYGWVKGLDLKTGKISLDRAQHRPGRRHAREARHLQAALRQGHGARADELAEGCLEDRRRAGVGLDVLRPRARSPLLRHRQPLAVQRRAAPRRQQVDLQRARAAAVGRLAGVGLPVHAARQLGLRRRRDDDPRGREDRRAQAQGARHVQQERLSVHARSRHRRSARCPAVRAGDVGEEHRPQDRPPGARSHASRPAPRRATSRASARASKAA